MQDLVLLDAIGAKMGYLTQRQRIISQNISNSDTPGYKPKDLVKADFEKVLQDVTRDGMKSVRLDTNNQGHLLPPGEAGARKVRAQDVTYEVAHSGNAVVLEEQLVNSSQTILDYNTMTSVYQKNVSMIKTAIGTAR